MIHAQSISKTFASPNALQNGSSEKLIPIIHELNLAIRAGQSASIQGPSGCGKSTLLYMLCGLEKADAGVINVAGNVLTSLNEVQQDAFRRQHIGLVFQQFHLIDCLSVWANITFTAKLANCFDHDYLDLLCDQLGLRPHKHKSVTDLSGGEQQRVAIARALAHKPAVLFADEPTGNLDEKTSQGVSELLYETCASLGTTLLLVTHSEEVAKRADAQFRMHLGKLITVDNS